MGDTRIPTRLDEPARILMWDAEPGGVARGLRLPGILLKDPITWIAAGLALAHVPGSKFTGGRHRRFLLHWVYWHLPFGSGFTARRRPTCGSSSDEPLRISADLEARTGIRRAVQALLAVLSATSLLLAPHVFLHPGPGPVTFLPPQIERASGWRPTGCPADYLDQMALFVLQLAYNVTPSSVDFQNAALLEYAAPRPMAPWRRPAGWRPSG